MTWLQWHVGWLAIFTVGLMFGLFRNPGNRVYLFWLGAMVATILMIFFHLFIMDVHPR